MKKSRINSIAYVKSIPCITISMNTAGHQSDNTQFRIELERLVNQAKSLLLEKYSNLGIQTTTVLKRLDAILTEISFDNHLKSLNIFISASIKEIVMSIWPVAHNRVQVADRFDIRPLVTIYNNTEEYHILLLSPKKIRLFYAINNKIVLEVKDDIFPVTKNLKFLLPNLKSSSPQEKEALSKFHGNIDKALIKLYNVTGMRYVIISSQDNYDRFMEFVLFSSIYAGHVPISNNLRKANIASETWIVIQRLQQEEKRKSIKLMQELLAKGKALKDTTAIVNAARCGKGDLLIINQDAKIDEQQEDLICEVVWDVISKRGNVVLVSEEEAKSCDTISLKLKY